MINTKCWVIINVDYLPEYRDGFLIPDVRQPSFIHLNKDRAEEELLRLKKTLPGKFVLFEAVATADAQITGTGVIEINRLEAPTR